MAGLSHGRARTAVACSNPRLGLGAGQVGRVDCTFAPAGSFLSRVLIPTSPALSPIAPPALDQRVVEHRRLVVLAYHHDSLVPHARKDHSLAVHLSSKAFLVDARSEEHTSELQSPVHLVCR